MELIELLDSPALSTINTLTETAEPPMIGPELAAALLSSTSAGLAVDPQNGRIYHRVTLTENGRSALLWLFREPGRIRATTTFASGNGQVTFNPFTGMGYTALEEERQLQPVTGREALLLHAPTAVPFAKPHGLALDPTTARLYVTGFGSNQVGIFDVSAARATAPALLEQVTVGEKPRAIALSSRTHRAYVLCTGDQSISSIRDPNFTLPLPTVSAVPNVASNQWSNQDVTLTLGFGPGLIVGPRELVSQSLGTVTIPPGTVSKTPVTIRFNQEGSASLFFAARGGDTLSSDPNPPIHLSPPGTFRVNIDKTPPVVTLAALDKQRWFGTALSPSRAPPPTPFSASPIPGMTARLRCAPRARQARRSLTARLTAARSATSPATASLPVPSLGSRSTASLLPSLSSVRLTDVPPVVSRRPYADCRMVSVAGAIPPCARKRPEPRGDRGRHGCGIEPRGDEPTSRWKSTSSFGSGALSNVRPSDFLFRQ